MVKLTVRQVANPKWLRCGALLLQWKPLPVTMHSLSQRENTLPQKKIKMIRISLACTHTLCHSGFNIIKITAQFLNIEFTDEQPITAAFDSFFILQQHRCHAWFWLGGCITFWLIKLRIYLIYSNSSYDFRYRTTLLILCLKLALENIYSYRSIALFKVGKVINAFSRQVR